MKARLTQIFVAVCGRIEFNRALGGWLAFIFGVAGGIVSNVIFNRLRRATM